MATNLFKVSATVTLLSVASLLVACQDAENRAPLQTAAAVPVETATVISAPLVNTQQFTGRLQAPELVHVMPRVSGYIQQVHFNEGHGVEAGDLLFSLDAAPFQADVDKLQASLREASSAQSLAERDLRRAKQLKQQQAIASELLDARQSKYEQAQAQVQALQAALKKAQLDLSYTQIRAPIRGKVSNAFITAGNYVQAGQTELTTVVSTGKIYAWFDADEQSLLRYLAKTKALSTQRQTPVLMALSNSEDFHYRGQLDFIDNQLNGRSGSIRLRASFDNADGKLLPGLFARLLLADPTAEAAADNPAAVLVSEKAIGTDLANRYVLVVDAQQILQYRQVVLGQKFGALRQIDSGLAAGEQIVVSGLQRVRAGSKVAPQSVDMASHDELRQLKQAQLAFAIPSQAEPSGQSTSSSNTVTALDATSKSPLTQSAR